MKQNALIHRNGTQMREKSTGVIIESTNNKGIKCLIERELIRSV
jgi:hypothetical protein